MFAKKNWIACACAGLLIGGAAVAQDSKPEKPEGLEDQAIYIFGHRTGESIRQMHMDVNMDLLIQGIKDALSEAEPLLNEEEMMACLKEFGPYIQTKIATANKAEGENFLAENGKRDGVTTLDNGLQYEVLTKGDGPIPTATDGALVNYTGKLIDGTVFDSSEGREPFDVNPVVGPPGQSVIEGWQKILQVMPEGSKWRVYIPSDLAYGENPRQGGPIMPNAVLIFDMELIKVTKN